MSATRFAALLVLSRVVRVLQNPQRCDDLMTALAGHRAGRSLLAIEEDRLPISQSFKLREPAELGGEDAIIDATPLFPPAGVQALPIGTARIFPDDAAAIVEAVQVAAELWTGRVNMSRQRLVVENERGETTHKEPLWKAFVRGL